VTYTETRIPAKYIMTILRPFNREKEKKICFGNNLGCLQYKSLMRSVGVGASCFDSALSTHEDARALRRTTLLCYISVFSLCIYVCLHIYVFTILFQCIFLSSNIAFRSRTIEIIIIQAVM